MSTLLDPELLRAFVAVAEHASFTRAARELNRTQAAVSVQVKRLEERVGQRLFWRSTTRVELSEPGKRLLADARDVLAVHARMLAGLTAGGRSVQLRLGVMEDYGTRVLPALLASAARAVPEVGVELSLGLTARMLRRLGTSYDAVIAMHGENHAGGELLATEDSPWAAAPVLECSGEAPLPLALSVRACLLRRWAENALTASRRRWRLAFVSPSMAAVEALALQGLAVTAVKRSMLPCGLQPLDDRADLPPLPRAEIRMHRARGVATPAARVLDLLRDGLAARAAA